MMLFRFIAARGLLRLARGVTALAEQMAPPIRADYVKPPERRPSTWTLAVALARLRLAHWRLALRSRIEP